MNKQDILKLLAEKERSIWGMFYADMGLHAIIYVIPLADMTEVQADLSRLKQYQRLNIETKFSIAEFLS